MGPLIRIASIGLLVSVLLAPLANAQGLDPGKADGFGASSNHADKDIPHAPGDLKKLSGGIKVFAKPTPFAPQPPSPVPGPKPPPVGDEVPYDTYSFLLVPDYDWESNNHDALPQVYDAYLKFSNLIGSHHLAVWFASSDVHGLDTGRSMQWCENLGLDQKNGPYVATMRMHPADLNLERDRDKVYVIQFNKISAPRVIHVLEVLADGLRNHNEIRELGVETQRVEEMLISLLDERGIADVVVHAVKPNPH